VKKLLLILFFLLPFVMTEAQEEKKNAAQLSKEEKKERLNNMMKQEEEGNLAYVKQTGFGLQLRTNGYGLFFELGRRRSQRFTNTYSIEITEIKHPKEEKSGGTFFQAPYIFGKVNNFYQAKLGFGQQYIFGQKGNKNGIAVIGLAQAGIALGFLKPYYIHTNSSGQEQTIRFSSSDSTVFLTYNPNNSAAGFTKGWKELEFRPGIFVKTGLRFDFGRFNESVQAIEIGLSVEGYSKEINIMAPVTSDKTAAGPQRLFYQGHIAFVFGRRK
jgi:hypothetical protein